MTRPLRLIHTADWHLGRKLFGTSLLEDQSAILEQFVDHVRDIKPNAVLIAGDVYDRAIPPVEAVDLLDSTLSRILMDIRVPVVMIAGNHDNHRRLSFGGAMMKSAGLHLPGHDDQPIVSLDAPTGGQIPIFGLHYEEPVVLADRFELAGVRSDDHDTVIRHWLNRIPEPLRARAMIMIHGFVAGGLETDSERPIHVGGAGQIGLDAFAPFAYTALGHLHRPQKYHQGRVSYAGGLMPFAFDEAGQDRHAWFVEWSGKSEDQPRLEALPLESPQPLKRVSGLFRDLLDGPRDLARMCVELLDTDALFEVASRLRERFPNLLTIERPTLNMQMARASHSVETSRKRSLAEMFDDFVRSQHEDGLTEDEQLALDQQIRDWQASLNKDHSLDNA